MPGVDAKATVILTATPGWANVPAHTVAHWCRANHARSSCAQRGKSRPKAARQQCLNGRRHEEFEIYHIIIQGESILHAAELAASLKLLKHLPAAVCLSETFSDKGMENIEPGWYVVVARRVRGDG